jgi:hypothetical protein
MDVYFRRIGFLSALAPYDGSYWRGLTVDDETPHAVEVNASVPERRASESSPRALEAPPRRCRVHQRRSNPPSLRGCLLCRPAVAKA